MGDGNSGLGGILSDSAIRKAVEYGDIEIDPFDPERLNPCSYDLALGNEIVSYQSGAGAPVPYLDARVRPGTYSFKFDDGMALHPNVGYLMHTVERVATKKYVPVLDGKSSLGRLFMKIHETAGYGDPGFDGQYTLEVTVMYPFLCARASECSESGVRRSGATRGPSDEPAEKASVRSIVVASQARLAIPRSAGTPARRSRPEERRSWGNAPYHANDLIAPVPRKQARARLTHAYSLLPNAWAIV